MRARCYQPKSPSFKYVGARGLTVCERWRDSFASFLEDMGPRPAGTSLDRIDNSKGYFPGNCRWATPLQQARNTRFNHILTFNGESLCVSEWAYRRGLATTTITARLRLGWPIENALTVPAVMGQTIFRRPATVKTGPNGRNKSSGVFGVSWHALRKKWSARVYFGKSKFYLGNYARKADAIAAVSAKVAELQEVSHAS